MPASYAVAAATGADTANTGPALTARIPGNARLDTDADPRDADQRALTRRIGTAQVEADADPRRTNLPRRALIVVVADAAANTGAVDADLPIGALLIGGTSVPTGAGPVDTDLRRGALIIVLAVTATAAGAGAVDTGLATRAVVSVLTSPTAANTCAINTGLAGAALVAIGALAATDTGAIDADLALVAVAVEATRAARDAATIDTDLRRCALRVGRATGTQRHALPINTGLVRRTRSSIRAGDACAHIAGCAALPAVPPCLGAVFSLATFEAGVATPFARLVRVRLGGGLVIGRSAGEKHRAERCRDEPAEQTAPRLRFAHRSCERIEPPLVHTIVSLSGPEDGLHLMPQPSNNHPALSEQYPNSS